MGNQQTQCHFYSSKRPTVNVPRLKVRSFATSQRLGEKSKCTFNLTLFHNLVPWWSWSMSVPPAEYPLYIRNSHLFSHVTNLSLKFHLHSFFSKLKAACKVELLRSHPSSIW